MKKEPKEKTLNATDILEKTRDIYWKLLKDVFKLDDDEHYKLKSRRELTGSIDPYLTVKSVYVLDSLYGKKTGGTLYKSDLSDKERNLIDGFYEKFKDAIIENIGQKNFVTFLTSALKNKKVYYSYDEDLTNENLFHTHCITDKNIRESYTQKMIVAAFTVDLDRNPKARNIKYRNTLYALKDLSENAPDLFNEAKNLVLNNSHFGVETNKLLFLNALKDEALIKECPDFVGFYKNFPELNAVKEKDMPLFEDVKLHTIRLNLNAVLQMNSNLNKETASSITEVLASALTEVFPEYTFEGGKTIYSVSDVRSNKPSVLFFSFDERLGSVEGVKSALSDLIKGSVQDLRKMNQFSLDKNTGILKRFVEIVQSTDMNNLITKNMDKVMNKKDTSPEVDDTTDTSFKI